MYMKKILIIILIIIGSILSSIFIPNGIIIYLFTLTIILTVAEWYQKKMYMTRVNRFILESNIKNVGAKEFTDKKCILMTSNYLFLSTKCKIYCYKYDDIVEMKTYVYPFIRYGTAYHRMIIFKANNEVFFQDNDGYYLVDNYNNMVEYLKSKNSKIVMEELKFKFLYKRNRKNKI